MTSPCIGFSGGCRHLSPKRLDRLHVGYDLAAASGEVFILNGTYQRSETEGERTSSILNRRACVAPLNLSALVHNQTWGRGEIGSSYHILHILEGEGGGEETRENVRLSSWTPSCPSPPPRSLGALVPG